VVTQQPQSSPLVIGGSYTLRPEGTATDPVAFQWYKNGQPIDGATSDSYQIAYALAADVGRYRVHAQNAAGEAWSEDAVLALPTPTVVVAPKDTTVDTSEESTVVFTADVVSTETIAFQWQVWVEDEPALMPIENRALALLASGHWENITDNGVFSGTNTRTLTLNQLSASMQGMRFRCVATDASGDEVATPVATLSLSAPEAPVITDQPVAATAVAGVAPWFSVTATSGLVLSYQWQVLPAGSSTWGDVADGVEYSGSKTSRLTVSTPTGVMHHNQYRCQISDGINPAVFSAAATLTVKWSQFSALSARAPAGTGEQTLILGFVFAGGGKPTLVCGVGPNMSETVNGYMRDPQLTLYTAGGSEVASNDNWDSTDALSTAFAQTGATPLVAGSKDAALLETLTGSVYTAHVTGVNGTTGVALAAAYDANLSDKTKRLTALSVRNQVGVDDAILIAGFVIAGDAPKQVIVRGVGPGLAKDVVAYLTDPQLLVHRLKDDRSGWDLVGSNDDWDGTTDTAALFKTVGMGELAGDSKDAALVLTLEPGIYTAQLTGVGRTTGVGVVEIYEVP
jgi:hypothetical protein